MGLILKAMANGRDSESNFAKVSSHRSGLKREHLFAVKVQAEICGSLGRTRSRKQLDNVVSVPPRNKRLKRCESKRKNKEEKRGDLHDPDKETDVMSEEEAKSDVVNDVNDEAKAACGDNREVAMDVEGELMCVDEVENGLERKNEKGNEAVSQEDVQVGVEEGMGQNDHAEVKVNEPEDLAIDMKGEKNNDCGGVVMEVEGDKCGRMGQAERDAPNSPVTILEEGGRNGPGSKLANELVEEPLRVKELEDDWKLANTVVEKPLRRFTRSMLQSNMQTVVSESGVIEKDVNESVNGGASGKVTLTKRKTISKPMSMRRFYTRLKDFLDSGILEGVGVTYFRSSKVKGSGVTGLQGVIKGSGILCFCDDCNGNDVVTPAVFELHAGSSNKRPPEYIYLRNGKTLRDVMNVCKDSPLETLEEAVTMSSGSSGMKSSFCLNCKASIGEPTGKSLLLCNICVELRESQAGSSVMADTSDGSLEPQSVRKSPEPDSIYGSSDPNSVQKSVEPISAEKFSDLNSEKSPETNVVPKSSHSSLKFSSSKKSQGRITRKDLRMHKLVFEEGGMDDGTEVAYYVRGQKLLVGYKRGTGILCTCCDTVVSPSQFEAHAGWASRRKPFQHIYTSNGVSLHEFSIYLSKNRKFSTKENDDLCGICADGGDLLCCEVCPRSFHTDGKSILPTILEKNLEWTWKGSPVNAPKTWHYPGWVRQQRYLLDMLSKDLDNRIDCISLPRIPVGPWQCRYCENTFQKERFVEHNANARAAGRVEGVDPIVEINNRCIRIVQTPDTELGGCVLCRGRDFCKSGFGLRTVMLCDQCEREYHVGCLRDHGMEDLKELPKGKWLCCADCKRINCAMQKLIDRGEEKLPDPILDIIKRKHQESGSESVANVDIRWRVLRGRKVDFSDGTRALLSKAVSIFHDRFDPIIDSASKLDLIPAMVYGRSHKGQDYHGMYCAILTVNQAVVSAGIFRIFGQELAELPLVATTKESQGQGYFQCLYSCIEKLLSYLKVEKLVLPSAHEAQMIWTNKFGFEMMAEEELEKCRNIYPLMSFQGTSMLHKPVPKCRIVGA